MALRRTVLLAFLLTMACSANAHEYVCKVEDTRSVAIGSFRFTKEDMRREQASHRDRPCPLPEDGVIGRRNETARTQSSPANPRPTGGIVVQPGDGYSGPANSCGVIGGDDYHHVSAMVYRYCTEQAQSVATANTNAAKARRPIRRHSGIGFKVTRPAAYNSKEHHKTYSFESGDVVGTCYVCVHQPITNAAQTGNTDAKD